MKYKLFTTTAGLAFAAAFAVNSAHAQCAPVVDTDNTFECSGAAGFPAPGGYTNDPDLTITILDEAEVDANSPFWINAGAEPGSTTIENNGTVANDFPELYNTVVFQGGTPGPDDGNDFSFTNTGSWQGGVYVGGLGGDFAFENSGEFLGRVAALGVFGDTTFTNSGSLDTLFNSILLTGASETEFGEDNGSTVEDGVRTTIYSSSYTPASGSVTVENSGEMDGDLIVQTDGEISVTNSGDMDGVALGRGTAAYTYDSLEVDDDPFDPLGYQSSYSYTRTQTASDAGLSVENAADGVINGDVQISASQYIYGYDDQGMTSSLTEEEDLGDGDTLTTRTFMSSSSYEYTSGYDGGAASFSNAGTVGAEDNLVQVNVIGPAGATLDNQGAIYTTNFSANIRSRETVYTSASENDLTDINTYDSSVGLETISIDETSSGSSGSTNIGGEASFTNGPDAMLVGSANVTGFAGANADLGGTVLGNVSVDSGFTDTTSSTDESLIIYDENPDGSVVSETVDGVTTTVTNPGRIVSWWLPQNDVYQRTEVRTNTNSRTYVGGEVSATVSGDMGTEGDPDDATDDVLASLNVEGAAGASADIAGTLVGSASVQSRGTNTTYTNTRTDIEDYEQTSTITEVVDGDVETITSERATSIERSSIAPYEQTETSESVGGVASVDISGTLGHSDPSFAYDSLYVNGFGGAEVDISGTALVSSIDIYSTGSSSTETETDGEILTEESSFSEERVFTTTDTGTSWTSMSSTDLAQVWDRDSSNSEVRESTGGEASLAVSGMIGSEEDPYRSVRVSGFSGAMADISGSLYGSLYLTSIGQESAFSAVQTEDRTHTESSTQYNEYDESGVNTRSVYDRDVTATTDETETSSSSYASTGGASTVDVSGMIGSDDYPGYVSLEGFGGVDVDVSGAVIGGINARSTGNAGESESSGTSSYTDMSANGYDITRTPSDTGVSVARSDYSDRTQTWIWDESGSSSSMSTGGEGSVAVSGTFGSEDNPFHEIYVNAFGGASADISGEAFGNVRLFSSGSNSGDEYTAAGERTDAVSQVTDRSYAESGYQTNYDQTRSTIDNDSSASTNSSYYMSTGGSSSLDVSGSLGSEDRPSNVNVSGIGGTDVSVDGALFGQVYQYSNGSSGESSSEDTYSREYTSDQVTSGTYHEDSFQLSAWTFEQTTSEDRANTDSYVESSETTGGVSSFSATGSVGSEDTPAYAYVSGFGGANADIEGDFVGDLSLVSSGSTFARTGDSADTLSRTTATSDDRTYDDTGTLLTRDDSYSSATETTYASSSASQTALTGGPVGVDVSGDFGTENNPGSISASSVGGVTADLSGNIIANVTLRSDTNSDYQSDYSTDSQGNTTSTSDQAWTQETTDVDGVTVVDTTYSSDSTYESASASASSDTRQTFGGTALLDLSGVVGSADNSVLVTVDGLAGAMANVSGTLFGDLSVFSDGRISRTDRTFDTTQSNSDSFSEARTTEDGDTTSFVQSIFDGNASSRTETYAYTFEETGADASVTNSSSDTITGTVNVVADDNADVVNTGVIGGNTLVQAAGSISQTEWTRVIDQEDTRSTETVDDVRTVDYDFTRSETFVEERAWEEDGGMASVLNSGTIGLDPFGTEANPESGFVLVNVDGQDGAIVDNSGTVNGDVRLNSDAYSRTSSEDFAQNETISEDSTIDFDSGDNERAYVRSFTREATNTYVDMDNGGDTDATNSGIIAGDLTTDAEGNSSVDNLGIIWGNVSSRADGRTYTDDWTDTFTEDRTQTFENGSLVTSDIERSGSYDEVETWSSTGGESVVNNTGSVGLREIDPFFTTTNPFDDPTGDISLNGGFLNSYGNAGSTVTNSAGAVVLSGITSSASGYDREETNSSAYTSRETLAENGDETYDYASTSSSTYSNTTRDVTSTVVNDGQVGVRLRDGMVIPGSSGFTPDANIVSSAAGGSSVTNNGRVSGGIQSYSNGTDTESSSESSSTTSRFEDGSTSANNTQSTTSSSSSSEEYTAVGGTAEIINSAGAFVGPEVSDVTAYTGSTSYSAASGLEGASLLNDGEFNGGWIEVLSHGVDQMMTTSSSVEQEQAGSFFTLQSSSESSHRNSSTEYTGGVASLINNNLMITEYYANVRGFAGASVQNSEDALFIGDIFADSGFLNTSDELTSDVERGLNGVLVSRDQTREYSETWTGADASVVNFGDIWGNVSSSAFGTASVFNDADSLIAGNVSVSSAYENRFFSAENSVDGPTDPVVSDTFTETKEYTGGVGVVDNFGDIDGNVQVDAFQSAGAFNDIFATIGGDVSLNALFENYTNVDGVESEEATGGTADFLNHGSVDGDFDVAAYMDATVTNTATGWIDLTSSASMTSAAGQNVLYNEGLIGDAPTVNLLSTYVGASLPGFGFGPGAVGESISFSGGSWVENYGVINAHLNFSNSWNDMDSTLFLNGGSLLFGNVASDTNLNVVMDDNGLYGGNISGATSFVKSGDGRWVLTGSSYELGEASVEGGTLQVGLPTFDIVQLFDLVGLVYPLNGFEPFEGNTLINSRFRDLGIRDEDILSFLRTTPRIDANLTVAEGAAFEGQAVIVGDVTNSGSFLPGYMLTQDGQPALENVLDNTNLILPGEVLITGDYTQTSTGTLVTNFNPLIDRPELEVFGVQDDILTSPDFALSVQPYEANDIPSGMLLVDGDANVSGEVALYVKRGGLYLDGESSDILAATGALNVDATVTPSAESLFIDFGLSTQSVGSQNVLSVVADRTSYGAFADTQAQEEVGAALDSALVAVANDIRTNNFSSVADLEAANDMAGFLAALDWNATSGAQVNSHLSDLGGSFIGSLALIDNGAGFLEATKSRRAGRDASLADDTGVWVEGNFTRTEVSDDVGTEGVEADTYSLSLGGDQRFGDKFLFGLAGGFSSTEADGDFGSNAEFNVASIGLYTNIAPAEKWYIDAMLWGQLGEAKFSRTLAMFDRETFAETDVSELRFDAEFGYNYPLSENVTLTPHGGARVRNVNFDGFEELGAGGLGLTVNDYDDTAFQPFIGAYINGEYQFDYDMWLAPSAGLQIMAGPDLDGPDGQFSVGGDTFRLSSVDSGDVVIAPTLGLNIQLDDNFALFAGYRGELSDAVDQHTGTLTVRFRW